MEEQESVEERTTSTWVKCLPTWTLDLYKKRKRDATFESREVIQPKHNCNVKPTSNIFSPSLHTSSDHKHPKNEEEDDCLPTTMVFIQDGNGLDKSSSAINEEEEVHLNNEVKNSLFDLATSSEVSDDVKDSFGGVKENIEKKRRKFSTSTDKVVVSDAAMLLSLFEI